MPYRVFARHRLVPTPVVVSYPTKAKADERAAEIVNAVLEAEGLPETATAASWHASLAEVAAIYDAAEAPLVTVTPVED
jgi:hypothetical protein